MVSHEMSLRLLVIGGTCFGQVRDHGKVAGSAKRRLKVTLISNKWTQEDPSMNGPGSASASAAVIQRSASRETKTERYQGTCHIGATAPRLWSLVNSTSLANQAL